MNEMGIVKEYFNFNKEELKIRLRAQYTIEELTKERIRVIEKIIKAKYGE